MWHRSAKEKREPIEAARIAYPSAMGRVWPLDGAIAVVAAEIVAMLPDPPTPPRRSHRLTESHHKSVCLAGDSTASSPPPHWLPDYP
jgi:hypothetical protein